MERSAMDWIMGIMALKISHPMLVFVLSSNLFGLPNQIIALTMIVGYHVFITAGTHENMMVNRMEWNTVECAGYESITFEERCGED
jgi:hypothetical protein